MNASKEECTGMGKIDFPVVGIGSSAGGLKVLQNFFEHLDSGSGLAFVVVTHLAPQKKVR